MNEPDIINQFKRERWHNFKMTFLNWSTDSIKSLSKSCAVFSHSVVSNSLWPHGLLCPWDFPGKNTGVDCHFLLQGIFPTQGSNPSLPHYRQMLYHLSHQGSPKRWLIFWKLGSGIKGTWQPIRYRRWERESKYNQKFLIWMNSGWHHWPNYREFRNRKTGV